MKWTELAQIRDCVFVVPLGALEQHGRHLPLITDTAIIAEIARRVESRMPRQIVLAPVQWLGHSPHHRRFGCVSLELTPYVEMIRGMCDSLIHMGARKICC